MLLLIAMHGKSIALLADVQMAARDVAYLLGCCSEQLAQWARICLTAETTKQMMSSAGSWVTLSLESIHCGFNCTQP